MWSFVKSKAPQRWLWHAIDPLTGVVLAYGFGSRADEGVYAVEKIAHPLWFSALLH